MVSTSVFDTDDIGSSPVSTTNAGSSLLAKRLFMRWKKECTTKLRHGSHSIEVMLLPQIGECDEAGES